MEEKKIPLNKNISKLDLSNSNLKEIPLEVFELKNLRKLNLSNNNFKRIPKEISQLKLLEVLDISNNKIPNFYAPICELRRLKSLNLNNNQITSLPKQIVKLEKLRKLSIANNKILNLPEELSKLENLTSLNLSKNPISELPNAIYNLPSLRQLWICNLPLKKILFSVLILRLKNLQAIYAFGNINERSLVDPDYFELSKFKGNSKIKMLEITLESTNKKVVAKEKTTNSISDEKNVNNTVEQTAESMIFISYSHHDSEWLTKVQTNISVLKHLNISFNLWDDEKIKGGEEWKEMISSALDKCKIGILLISTEFLASDFIRNDELPKLLRNAESKGTIIIPVIVGHSMFTDLPNLSRFQTINKPSEPLEDVSKSQQNKILVALAKRIKEILLSE